MGNWLGQDKNNYSTKIRWQLNSGGNQPLNAQPICKWSVCYIKRLTLFIFNNDSGPRGDTQCRESPYIVSPILEAGELRLREVKWLAQNDLTGWQESQDSKPSQAFKPHGATSKYLLQVTSTHWPFPCGPKLHEIAICIHKGWDKICISLNIMAPSFPYHVDFLKVEF